MKHTLSLCFAALLFLATANADTVFSSSPTSITDILQATLDGESAGLHAQINGQMTYNPQLAVDGVVSQSALTSFNLTLIETFAYGWNAPGISDNPVTYQIGMDMLENFSYNMSTDKLAFQVAFNPDNPRAVLAVFDNPGGAIPEDIGDTIGFIPQDAYGYFDPLQVTPDSAPVGAGLAAPEPYMLPLVGLVLVFIGAFKNRRRSANI